MQGRGVCKEGRLDEWLSVKRKRGGRVYQERRGEGW